LTEVDGKFIPCGSGQCHQKWQQRLAEGAGTDLLDIVALNARSEIANAHLSAAGKLRPFRDQGCTSVAVLPRIGQDEGRLMGQNWD